MTAPTPAAVAPASARLVVRKVAGQVVVRGHDLAERDGRPRQSLAEAQGTHPERLAVGLGQPRIEGQLEALGRRVELVDDGTVRAQQATGLVDDVLEEIVCLADRG